MDRAAEDLGWFRRLYSTSVGTLRQSYLALLLSVLAASLAGFLLGRFDHLLLLLPGLIIMVPGAVGMRGNIFSTLGSRLGTGMHLGLIDGLDLANEHVRENIQAPILLTLVMSVVLGLYAKILSTFLGLASVGVSHFVVISFVAGVLSGVIMIVLTFAISMVSFARGLDPDNVTSPLIAAAGDLFTLPCLIAAAILVLSYPILVTPAFHAILIVSLVCLLYSKTSSPTVRAIFSQTASVMLFSSLLSSLAGLLMQHNISLLLAYPVVLVMLPAFLGCGGNLGNIASARLSTKLHLGLVEARLVLSEKVLEEFFVALVLALLVFPFIGASAHVVSYFAGASSPGLYSMIILSTVAGFALTLVVAAMTFILSIVAYGRGWNPDNVLIPLVSSSTDLLATATLIFSVAVAGVF